MKKKQLSKLKFIETTKLYDVVSDLIKDIKKSEVDIGERVNKNGLDVFSALFSSLTMQKSLSEWFEEEMKIKAQKSWQNSMGLFHQNILGNFTGWRDLGTGNIVDLVNDDLKIIAEIKNKHNTTKGNHKIAIYDDFKKLLNGKYKGYTAYYVEVIPRPGKRYNIEFTPSDNKISKRRPKNKNIRKIDGYSFYELAAGEKDAMLKVYKELPFVIAHLLELSPALIEKDEMFMRIFNEVYQQKK